MRPLGSWMIGVAVFAGGMASVGMPDVAAGQAMPAQTAEQLYLDGVRARRAGHTDEAIELLSRAAAAEPRNADVLLQRGLAQADAGCLEAARADLNEVLRLAPDYADARLALARIALRENQTAQAQAQLQKVLTVEPANREARLLQARLLVQSGRVQAAERPRFRLDINGSLSHLSNDLPHWREGAVRLAYAANDRTTYSGGMDVSHRFGTTDTYIEGRVDHQFTGRLAAYVYAGGTPDASLLPEVALGSGISARLQQPGGRHATFATLDGRFARYVTGNVWSLNPGLVQYLASDRLWLTARWINTLDEQNHYLTGWSLRADWQAWDRARLLAGYANAPESSDGITVRTRAIYGGLAYDLDERNSIQLIGAHEKRAGLYDRNSITLGLTTRF
ncbi:YaiO family outer membrane beta-barrel protein [Bordetella petrii]|uniref:YaiO family outer membrane beta-barrel protein n=1 Tax=Bordetella petrii TaxID=94624 RepID=UPI001A975FE1|nr:YaiO family outer membrane beta-barrel protein [Bordetella petrii]MBO1114246.1 YaiO family outer membrane beta-barrel protein [Bordetella petrii]